jgi:catechol 2,3-dioxygenase-like lactoylglutathione lyase family enzyme
LEAIMSLQLRICIDVDELEKGIAFYTEALGLTVGRRLGKSWVELLGAAVPVDLLAEKPGTAPIPLGGSLRDYRRHWTPVHLDWPVADLDAALRRAQAAGATLEGGIREKKWGRLAILADPFGNGFCLLEFRGRGYDELIGS